MSSADASLSKQQHQRTTDDAAVLEDVLCGLRQQQLFQLHLLRQLQCQIDELVVNGGVMLGGESSRHGQGQKTSPSAAGSMTSSELSLPSPPSTVTASPSPYHVTVTSSQPTMTSQCMSAMSAMIDMSRKQLDQLPHFTQAPSGDCEYSYTGFFS